MQDDRIQRALGESKEGNDLSDELLQKMYTLFMERVYMPSTKPSRQLILCPVGLVGAGKSTVVVPLSQRVFLVRIAGDEVRKILKEHGFNYVRTREIVRMAVENLIQEGYSIALDSDCIDIAIQEFIADLQNQYGITPIWIHINPPESFIVEKLTTYQHTWLFKDAQHALRVLHMRKILHETYLKMISFDFTFDTSRSDLSMQIEHCVKAIEQRCMVI